MFRQIAQNIRQVSTCAILRRAEDKRIMLKTMPKKDDGSQGEKSTEIDVVGYSNICEFPRVGTDERLFNGVMFKNLPIIHIRVTKNNTLLDLTNDKGVVLYTRTCGVDGFKNCRKGTNIAAQITATAFAKMIVKMGYSTCRVCINGLGAGRSSSFKGLQMGGVDVVSITDTTAIFDYPKLRPPAAKSL